MSAAEQGKLKEARVPLGWRDKCSSLLIPLNVCRHETNYATWKCDHERHEYEKCQYEDLLVRMKAFERQQRKALEEAQG